MGKTTVKPGNSHISEGGRMPSTIERHKSGENRGNNPPNSTAGSTTNSSNSVKK